MELRECEIEVADHRVVGGVSLRLLDVPRPARVNAGRIGARTDHLDVAVVNFRLDPGHVAELGRANGGEICRMGEQHASRVSRPIMEVKLPRCSRREVADPPCHRVPQFRRTPAPNRKYRHDWKAKDIAERRRAAHKAPRSRTTYGAELLISRSLIGFAAQRQSFASRHPRGQVISAKTGTIALESSDPPLAAWNCWARSLIVCNGWVHSYDIL